MFFGSEKINRKSCSEEKKVRVKIKQFYGLESGLGNARRKLFRVARRFIGRRRGFWKIFGGFYNFFYNFFGIFCDFFGIFCNFFGKFSQNFCNFFRLLQFPYDFSENFSENSRPQSVTVQPGSRHYCKFTIKFTSRITPKFTLILIKILQSTKFEGSHFHNLLATFTTFHNSLSTFTDTNRFSQFLISFRNLLRPPKTLLLAAAFSQP